MIYFSRGYNFKADGIVFSNFAARSDLPGGLQKAAVCAVGDCTEPPRIYDAIHEGHLAALSISKSMNKKV